jgi:REP element-mobilizing transposase RayT
MPEKYKNQYKIESSRLAGYDYTQNGMYFVTICTKEREEFFGTIKDGKIELSEIGKIVENFWQEIPKHFTSVILDEYVIMPNHLHGIVEINNDKSVETQFIACDGVPNANSNCRDAINRVSTGDTLKTGGITGDHNPMLNPGSLSKMMRWYKGRCAFEIRKQLNPITFAWQPRFYDHIIRNEISLNKIREYIQTNPEMWERDRNNVENLWM